MNKRIAAMLMALAMLISLVPMTLLAEDDACKHENVTYVSTEAGKHDMKCVDCGYKYGFNFSCSGSDTDYDGICDKCGYVYKPAVCEHTSKSIKDNGDGTHTYYCRGCSAELNTEAHTYSNGACTCGALGGHECDLDGKTVDNGNGTHSVTCSGCGKPSAVELPHADANGDGKCDSCNCEMYTCKHTSKSVKNNNDGTHTFFCRDCGVQLNTVDHTYDETTDACVCGAIRPVNTCEHKAEDWSEEVVSNGKGQHSFICTKCGEYVQMINCQDPDGDGKCDSCGYEMYTCKHTSKSVKNNNDGTHTFFCRDCGVQLNTEDHTYDEATDTCLCGAIRPVNTCEHKAEDWSEKVVSNGKGQHSFVCTKCGEYVLLVNCLDPDGDGKCDSCGYQMYVSPACKHTRVLLKNNEDGKTHKVTCDQCKVVLVEKEAHEYNEFGICACGAIKPAEKPDSGNEGGSTGSTTTNNTNSANLDKVPKTGDNGITTALGSSLLLSAMSIVAFFTTGKKFI